jgi:hypothetical protein
MDINAKGINRDTEAQAELSFTSQMSFADSANFKALCLDVFLPRSIQVLDSSDYCASKSCKVRQDRCVWITGWGPNFTMIHIYARPLFHPAINIIRTKNLEKQSLIS